MNILNLFKKKETQSITPASMKCSNCKKEMHLKYSINEKSSTIFYHCGSCGNSIVFPIEKKNIEIFINSKYNYEIYMTSGNWRFQLDEVSIDSLKRYVNVPLEEK